MNNSTSSRLLFAFLVSASLSIFCISAHAGFAFLTVNEILIDPNSSDGANYDTDLDGTAESEDEFIEFFNATSEAADISGYELWVSSGGVLNKQFVFPPETNILSGQFVTLVGEWDNGDATPIPEDFFEIGTNVFSNGGDNFVIYRPVTGKFDSYVYNGDADLNGSGLPIVPGAYQPNATIDLGSDTDGESLSRTPDGTGEFASSATHTPGLANAPEPNGAATVTFGGLGLAWFVRRKYLRG